MADMARLVRIGALANLGGLVGQKLFAAGSMVLLVRGLSIADFGRYSLFVAAVVMLANLTFGLDKIVQRYFPLLLSDSPGQARALLGVFLLKRVFLLAALVGVVIALSRSGLLDLERFNITHPAWAVSLGVLMALRQLLALALNAAYLEHRVLNGVLIGADMMRFLLYLTLWQGALSQALGIWAAGELLICAAIVLRLRWRLKAGGAKGAARASWRFN